MARGRNEWPSGKRIERWKRGPCRIRYIIWRPSSQLDETVNIDNAVGWKVFFPSSFFFIYICWISYSVYIESLSLSPFEFSSLLFLIFARKCYIYELSERWNWSPLECTIFFHEYFRDLFFWKKCPAQRTNGSQKMKMEGRFNTTWRKLSVHIDVC
jgi:hypothetical protein